MTKRTADPSNPAVPSSLRITPYDVAEHLRTPEEMAAYLDAWLEEQGTEPCADGQLLLKRTLSAAGSGRQFVNGSPCTLSVLKALGDRLVDLHGPHDHQSLFSREAQTRVLDAYAGAAAVAGDFAAAHRESSNLAAEIQRLRALEQDATLRREILTHAAGEIAAFGSMTNVRVDHEGRPKPIREDERAALI